MTRRPFAGLAGAIVTLPDRPADPFAPVSQFCQLLIAEQAELEAELGCPVTIGSSDGAGTEPGTGRCFVGPSVDNTAMREILRDLGRPVPNGPVVWIDRDRCMVGIDGPSLSDVGDAFQWLRTASRLNVPELVPSVPASPQDMLERIEVEVADTYPAFTLRGIDWHDVVERHRENVLAHHGSLPALQRLLAELKDAHTWVRDTRLNARAPYRVWLDGGRARFVDVPAWTAAASVGVRPGDELLGVDGAEWWARTAAAPRCRALVAGFRALMGAVGDEREMRARIANGQIVEWNERFEPTPYQTPLAWHARSSGTAYLRIRGWTMSADWIGRLDAAFAGLADAPRLIVDLRGNVGGQLIAAQLFRDRFLPSDRHLGAIRFSIGGGALGEERPIVGRPARSGPRWLKPVRFLVDRQTYSASEDAVLGLGGLPQVEIVGERTGGGSGRPRTLPLGNDLALTISTALTYGGNGQVVEGQGLAVDVPLPMDAHFDDPAGVTADAILELADSRW